MGSTPPGCGTAEAVVSGHGRACNEADRNADRHEAGAAGEKSAAGARRRAWSRRTLFQQRYSRSSYSAPLIGPNAVRNDRVGAAALCASRAAASVQASTSVRWFSRLACTSASKPRLPAVPRLASASLRTSAAPSSRFGGTMSAWVTT